MTLAHRPKNAEARGGASCVQAATLVGVGVHRDIELGRGTQMETLCHHAMDIAKNPLELCHVRSARIMHM